MVIVNEYFRVEEIFLGKTFDDFTLNPQCSVSEDRGSIPLKTRFSKNIFLNLPVVSANMRTVTGPAMAIAMAQDGGIGILPRGGTPIDQEVSWVKEVKRAENFIIENPYTIREDQTLIEAKEIMGQRRIGTLLITNQADQFVGLLSAKRKMMLCGENDNGKKVAELMTPPEQAGYTTRGSINSVKEAAE